jgi:1-deoxy-D-xylulose-5-phosphate synthase
VDGHDLGDLVELLRQLKDVKGPVLLHALTRKGKGYKYSEDDSRKYHGVASFDKLTGASAKKTGGSIPSYTEIYGQTMIDLASADRSIVAITAAMTDGTGLAKYATTLPAQFHDVGIAEQHGTCFAAGLAAAGMKPFVTIYSTFLQRAYDQIVHDVVVQNLPVRFALDRAGLVGEDGATHHGLFDIGYLRCLPNMVLMAPKDENELRHMLATMAGYSAGPIAVRYPRGNGLGVTLDTKLTPLPIGEGELLRNGSDLLLVAYGTMVPAADKAAQLLEARGIKAALINARFAKPLDERLILEWARRVPRVATLEEAALPGGFGDAVLEFLTTQGIDDLRIRRFGVPDRLFDHATRDALLRAAGLTPEVLAAELERFLRDDPRSTPEPIAPAVTRA